MPKNLTVEMFKKIMHRQRRHAALEGVDDNAQSNAFKTVPNFCRVSGMKPGPFCQDLGDVDIKVGEENDVCDICEELNSPG